jgi:3-keto steroid reductase
LRKFVEKSAFAKELKKDAERQGKTFDWRPLAARVHLLGVEVELTNLCQIYEVSKKIRGEGGGIGSPDGLQNIQIPRLDALIMNAGIGGWKGLNWPLAIWDVLTKLPDSVTWPEYKISYVGATVNQQLGLESSEGAGETQRLLNGIGHAKDDTDKGEPVLGEVFCANVFGHYLLAHELMPLLGTSSDRDSGDKGRIIWVSSIEAQNQIIDEDDFQNLTSIHPYEYSKRITDIIALTSNLPSVQKVSESWFRVKKGTEEQKPFHRPELYVTHPGICATSIIDIAWILKMAVMAALYIARFVFGGIWHPVTSYKGAVAPVWVALAEQSTLDSMEANGSQKAKWGSSTDRWGNERVRRTEVGGWGWRGVVGETDADLMKGRKKGMLALTLEQREEFEAVGARCWWKMEELRREWEERLGIGSD